MAPSPPSIAATIRSSAAACSGVSSAGAGSPPSASRSAGCGPLDAPLRRLRRDERERAARGRAVVVGEPEREVDERRRKPGEDRLDGLRVDPLRRLVGDLDDDPAHAPAAEPDAHDRALLDVVLDRVGERPVERAGGDEREDGGEAGHGGPA